MEIINTQIKALFKTKGAFSQHIGVNSKDLSSKFKSLNNKIKWINDFLKPLNLRIYISKIKD